MVKPTPRMRGRKAVEVRKRRLLRTNYLCEWCKAKGRLTIATVVDHTIPLAHGGPDTDENTRNLCDDCNEEATAQQFGHKRKVQIGVDGWPVG